eukprot:s492_g14.t2
MSHEVKTAGEPPQDLNQFQLLTDLFGTGPRDHEKPSLRCHISMLLTDEPMAGWQVQAVGALSGESLGTVTLPQDGSLRELKRLIANLPGVSATVKLFFDGVELRGQSSLADSGLRDGCEVQVISVRSLQMLSGSQDGMARLWELEERSEVQRFQHSAELNGVAASPEPGIFASACSDRSISLWRFGSTETSCQMLGHMGQVYSVDFCPAGSALLSASGDATARLWDLASEQELLCLRGHMRDVNSATVSPDGRVFATGSDDYSFAVWDRASGKMTQHWDGRRGDGHSGRVYSVAFSPDGLYLATGAVDKKAKVWDTRTGACLRCYSGHTDLVNAVTFSPDGKLLASASDDFTSHVWTADTSQGRIASYKQDAEVLTLSFSGNGQTLATGSMTGAICLWDLSSHQEVGCFGESAARGVPKLQLLPGGCRTLAVGEGDFAFSEGLSASRSSGGAPELVVTCLEPEEDIRSQYADADERLVRLRGAGAKVICGVDATELLKGPLENEEPFERIVFNFPLLPMKVHKPRASSADVQIANRAMLVEFLRGAATFLRKDGLLLIANKAPADAYSFCSTTSVLATDPSCAPRDSGPPRDASLPVGRFGSDAAPTPAAARDEIREVTRNLQHLQADLMKPLQEALDNEPSEDMVPWVDTLLSEVETQVQQLQEQAQICMEHDHFDIAERIVNCASDFEEMRVRAASWKEEASQRASREAEAAAQDPPPTARDRVPSASSPQVGRLASIKSEGTPTDSAFGSAQPSPASRPPAHSQGSPSPAAGSPAASPASSVPPSPARPAAQATTSPSADPFGSAKSQAAQSPTSGAFGSMKSQVPPSPAGPADASRSQAAQSPSAGTFGSVKSQVPPSPTGPAATDASRSQAPQSPSADPFGSVKSQAAQSPTSGAFGSMKSQVPPSPAGPADASRSQAAQSPSAGAFGSVKSQVPPSPSAWPAAQQSPGGAFGSLSSFKAPPSPAAGLSASEVARSPAAGPTVSFASQGRQGLGASPAGSPPADPWQSLRSWMGDPFGTSAIQTSTAAWPATQVSSPDVGKRNSFSSKSPASARFDMWPKAAGDTEPAGWPDASTPGASDASPALAAQQSPAGGRSVASAASVRLKREQEAAKRTLASAMGGSQPLLETSPEFLISEFLIFGERIAQASAAFPPTFAMVAGKWFSVVVALAHASSPECEDAPLVQLQASLPMRDEKAKREMRECSPDDLGCMAREEACSFAKRMASDWPLHYESMQQIHSQLTDVLLAASADPDFECSDPASCTTDVIKYESDNPGAKYGMKSGKFAAKAGADTLKEILKDAKVKPFVQEFVEDQLDDAFGDLWESTIKGYNTRLWALNATVYRNSELYPNGTIKEVSNATRDRMYEDLKGVHDAMLGSIQLFLTDRAIKTTAGAYLSQFASLHVSVMANLLGSLKYRTAGDRYVFQTVLACYAQRVYERATAALKSRMSALEAHEDDQGTGECCLLWTCRKCQFLSGEFKDTWKLSCDWKNSGYHTYCVTTQCMFGPVPFARRMSRHCYQRHREEVENQTVSFWQNWLTPLPIWLDSIALMQSIPDMHFLATAVHGAKSCGLDEAEPDLVQQAERTLEKAQRETSLAELRESLGSATSAVSARLSAQDPAPEDVTKLRSVLGEARASASFSDAELVQAEQTLFKASQLQQATLQQAASPAASPKPSQASSPARVPVMPAAATPMSSPASPASPTPPAEQMAMKDKVSKLLQTLLAGGSAPESLRKAAEVAAAAGLAPEICAYARSAAERRSIAHEKAVAALASANLDAIRQAKIDVELAGGPNSDLRQLTQVLDMQRGPVPATAPATASGFHSQVDVEELRQREEQLLQRLRQARGRHLDELRRESSPPSTRQVGFSGFSAPALAQYQPDLRKIQQPRRLAETPLEEAQARARREMQTEPDIRKVPRPTTNIRDMASRPLAPQSDGALADSIHGDHGERWLNPFGIDPVKQAFDPMGLPPSDYKSMLTNARRLMQAPGRPFESPSFWRADGRDCYPYSWWRLESLPEWAGGQLAFMGAIPWQYTEYPSLYGGPCNVNRDASVKPTDATIFLYAHRDSENFRPALEAASSWRYCCDPGQSKQGPFSFRCDMCHVSTRTAGDLHAHEAGKIHKKRAHLERLWKAALKDAVDRSILQVTCNLHLLRSTPDAQEEAATGPHPALERCDWCCPPLTALATLLPKSPTEGTCDAWHR